MIAQGTMASFTISPYVENTLPEILDRSLMVSSPHPATEMDTTYPFKVHRFGMESAYTAQRRLLFHAGLRPRDSFWLLLLLAADRKIALVASCGTTDETVGRKRESIAIAPTSAPRRRSLGFLRVKGAVSAESHAAFDGVRGRSRSPSPPRRSNSA